jgi:hypothetical protein
VLQYVEFELHNNNLHYSIGELHLLLNQMRVIEVHHADNNTYALLEDAPPELLSIYRALKIKGRKKFSQKQEHVVP